MSAPRLRAMPSGQSSALPNGQRSFDRAKLSGPTLFLLAALRCYAILGVAIAVYAFFRALH